MKALHPVSVHWEKEMLFKYNKRGLLALSLMLAAGLAAAAPPPTAYDAIVAAVDWADVITGIAAIAALIAAVLVVKRGTGMLLRMIGR